ncbi:carbon-nitrogen hydrolase family protein [Pseudoalteromonas luteoviolacea]|uniref:CN hydrolase domain-containing protein n=1 Tax=Pseudoalteromonas luteoviolacea DSM 6061 TaxID=1365250 RepID=A0A166V2I9_9GAMM|nr:carbon-nitrogen hydrolase family protein [Pseudoalteromonas luteoviolacea]KZN31645.1 hypothetical protein N475_04120 [Pseudoalteromonas luteoviolacea DSM 6061]MBE0388978.1 hypothetical protein [Pseudoalteromonas luteoviolacea DSM 6061]
MKLAVAQSCSTRGDVTLNIENHIKYAREASKLGVSYLIFPELSLTGYELDVAKEVAFELDDVRLQPLFEAAKDYQISLGVGAPMTSQGSLKIGLFVIHKDGTAEVYEKMHLHEGEEVYFNNGNTYHLIEVGGQRVANAICADTTNPSHAKGCAELGATVYIAGVLVTPQGYAKDASLWSSYAKKHNMLVAIANYNQPSGGLAAAGKSAVWYGDQLLAQANEDDDVLVVAQITDEGWSAKVYQV